MVSLACWRRTLGMVCMSDQADGLRRLMSARRREARVAGYAAGTSTGVDAVVAAEARSRQARSILLTSGKGGVGTSNLSLNLAIALRQLGARVLLIDGDFGLANLDLLCGFAHPRDLVDVLQAPGDIREVVHIGPGGIHMLPGTHGTRSLPDCLVDAPARLVRQLSELERAHDFLIVDAGSGLTDSARVLADAADELIVVTTPEPTSLMDALASMRVLTRGSAGRPKLSAIVNQAVTASEGSDCLRALADLAWRNLGVRLEPLGHVRYDEHVRWAVKTGRPFMLAHPRSVAARSVRGMARGLVRVGRPGTLRAGFFELLIPSLFFWKGDATASNTGRRSAKQGCDADRLAPT